MCTAAASWSRAAKAAQTQESIPPLRRTTARDLPTFARADIAGDLRSTNYELRFTSWTAFTHCFSNRQSQIVNRKFSNSLHRRIPDKLVNLQAQACGHIVR